VYHYRIPLRNIDRSIARDWPTAAFTPNELDAFVCRLARLNIRHILYHNDFVENNEATDVSYDWFDAHLDSPQTFAQGRIQLYRVPDAGLACGSEDEETQ